MKQVFPGVFKIQKNFATLNAVPGHSVYNERRVKEKGKEYRIWDYRRSKPAAALMKGLKNFPIKPDSIMLYLGIANGTTASHFSDIMYNDEGIILGVDIAPKTFEKLLEVCEQRENIIPILADANKPEKYAEYIENIGGKVDIIYQDLAQRTQADILIKNAKQYLKKNGYIIYMIKARSIDVAAKPSVIFKKEIEKLEKAGFKIIETRHLSPFEKDHAVVVAKY